MRKIKHLLNRPRLRALASRSANGDPVYGCRGPGEDCVALSFDDGPSAANTGQLLELLEDYGARATFFVAATVARFVGGARGGDIILMHDGGAERPATLGAIDRALAALAARLLRCVTVSELLAAHSG